MPFAVDRRRVVHETIDGEAILIHMETGFYYSLEGTGSEIWGGLVAGRGPEEIAERLGARYDATPEAIEAAVSGLVEELCREGLLEEAEGHPAGESATDGAAPADSAAPGAAFEAPVLHRYTDMADFMLVDPIHEVDESGWPHQKVAP